MRRLIALLSLVLALLLLAPPTNANPADSPAGDTVSSPADDGPGSGKGSDDGTGKQDKPGGPGGDTPGGAGPGPGAPQNPATGRPLPRVMLRAFTTEPAVVPAGQSFRAHFTLQNMSKKVKVSNLKVTFSGSDGALLPNNGSSSTYIESIKPGKSVSGSMDFTALPSLEDRPYQLTFSVEYEDPDFNALSSQETVSVLIKQDQRASTTPVKVSPQEVAVGQEASLTFSIANLGKAKMHNARVSITEGQGLRPTEHFVGTVDAGASSNVELLVMADEPGPVSAKVVVTYEDAEGKQNTLESPVEFLVGEPVKPNDFPPLTPPSVDDEPADAGYTWLPWLIGFGVLAGAVLVLVVWLRRRRRKREELDDLQFLDGPIAPGV